MKTSRFSDPQIDLCDPAQGWGGYKAFSFRFFVQRRNKNVERLPKQPEICHGA